MERQEKKWGGRVPLELLSIIITSFASPHKLERRSEDIRGWAGKG